MSAPRSSVTRARRAPLSVALSALLLSACGGYAEGTAQARRALQEGRPREAEVALTAAIEEGDARDRPLLLLERAVARQRVGDYAAAAGDLQEADDRLEVLDYTSATAQEVSRYLFSDDAAPYRAQPFEKLLVNVLGAASRLAAGEALAAKVEARRLQVYQDFAEERRAESPAFAAALDALRPLCDLVGAAALAAAGDRAAAARLLTAEGAPEGYAPLAEALAAPSDGRAEVLALAGEGLIPHKRGVRFPLGAAVVYMNSQAAFTHEERQRARALAVQGAVKWLNFVELVSPSPAPSPRALEVRLPDDGALRAAPTASASLEALARLSFELAQPKIFIAAFTRLLTRAAAGGVTRELAGRAGGGLVGLLAGLAAEGAMSAADTPDTRGWTSLPARLDAYWLRLPPGDVTLSWGASARRLSLRAGDVYVVLFP